LALKPLSDADFHQEVREHIEEPVLVKFHAPGCKPCAAMDTVLEDLQSAMSDVKFVSCNVEDAPVTASELGIRSVPTMALFLDGMVRDMVSGTHSKADLRHWIQDNA
jgi:thioredoxin-like negative regulator of GroEL